MIQCLINSNYIDQNFLLKIFQAYVLLQSKRVYPHLKKNNLITCICKAMDKER